MLLVYQFSEVVAADGSTAVDGLDEGPVARFGVLTILVATLAIAAWRRRRRGVPAPSR